MFSVPMLSIKSNNTTPGHIGGIRNCSRIKFRPGKKDEDLTQCSIFEQVTSERVVAFC